MKTFETGKTYTCRSACDYDTIFSYEVVKRTAKTLTLKTWRGDTVRRGIAPSYCGNYETCLPEGRYSMCPVITAE